MSDHLDDLMSHTTLGNIETEITGGGIDCGLKRLCELVSGCPTYHAAAQQAELELTGEKMADDVYDWNMSHDLERFTIDGDE